MSASAHRAASQDSALLPKAPRARSALFHPLAAKEKRPSQGIESEFFGINLLPNGVVVKKTGVWIIAVWRL
jgi:hypothetical protein